MDWRDNAACRGVDPRLFDPLSGQERRAHSNPLAHARVRQALAVCQGCPVRAVCDASADESGEVGVWGAEYRSTPSTVRSTSGASLQGRQGKRAAA